QTALHERALQTPRGEWVVGFLYDDGKTPRPIAMIVRAFSRIDESACNPKPKNPFNVLHDDLANHTHNFRPCALSLSRLTRFDFARPFFTRTATPPADPPAPPCAPVNNKLPPQSHPKTQLPPHTSTGRSASLQTKTSKSA